jgi:nucleoid-associated protein YgaU
MGKSATTFGILLIFVLLATVIFFMVKATGTSPAQAKGTPPPANQKREKDPAVKQFTVENPNPAPQKKQGPRIQRRSAEDPGGRFSGPPKPSRDRSQPPGGSNRRHQKQQGGSAAGKRTNLSVHLGALQGPAEYAFPTFAEYLLASESRDKPAEDPGRNVAITNQGSRSGGSLRTGRAGERPKPTKPQKDPNLDPSTPAEPRFITYKVQAGDSLWSIAVKHYGDGSKWEEIRKANPGLPGNGRDLRRDQILKIPVLPPPLPKKPAVVEKLPDNLRLYIIKRGDTTWDIVKEQYGAWSPHLAAEIRALNPRINLDFLRIGQAIRLPVVPGKGPKAPGPAQAEKEPERTPSRA